MQWRLARFMAASVWLAAGAWPLAGQTLDCGYLFLDRTWETQNTAGGPHLIGCGATEPLQHAANLLGEHTTLAWKITDRRPPLIRLRGTGKHVERLALLGNQWNPNSGQYDKQGSAKAACGIEVKWDPGLGSGKHILSDLRISHFQVGIRAGAPGGTPMNCDECRVADCRWTNCDVGFLATHNQVMGWTFDHPAFVADSPDDAMFFFQGGGDLHVYRGFAPLGCTLLRLANQADIGPNNAAYNFYSFKVDSQAGNKFRAVEVVDNDSDAWLPATVNLYGLHLPVGNQSYAETGDVLASIAGATHVNFIGCKFERPLRQAFRWRQEDPRWTPSYYFSGCVFRGITNSTQLMDQAGSRGNCTWDFGDGNINETGTRIPRHLTTAAGQAQAP